MRATASDAHIATAIDAILTAPVLVVGSPPPLGRDLDLLAVGPEYTAITEWLEGAGFLRWRQSWARFSVEGTYGVDLSSAERWASRCFSSTRLLHDAEPIPGFRHLVIPSPSTVLLLAARGMVTRRGLITAKVRARVTKALERDPEAWSSMDELARVVGMSGAARLLRRAYESPGPLPMTARLSGLAGVWLHRGPMVAKAKVFVDARPRYVRPAVVSFSGLDGSGKSTQVRELHTSLVNLGVPTEVQWAGFKTGSSLRRAFPVLERTSVLGASRVQSATNGAAMRDPLVPSACLGSPLGQHLWMYSVVALNTINLWRYVLRPRRGTKVLIFDRFSPDSAVKLDFHYGLNRGLNIIRQRALFKVLSPKPNVGFLVAVPSEVAYARRQDQTPDELTSMARLYDDQVHRFGLQRLDGTRAADKLSRQIAMAVWQGLP